MMRYRPVVRSYLVRLVGVDLAEPAAERAFAELAALPGDLPGTAVEIAAVGRIARTAGLEALAEARTGGWNGIRLIPRRAACAGIVRRLRDRADGRISADELGAFYRHVASCQACADIAGRFDAAEWSLQVELRAIGAGPGGLAEAEVGGLAHVERLSPEPEPEPEPEPALARTGGPASTPAWPTAISIPPGWLPTDELAVSPAPLEPRPAAQPAARVPLPPYAARRRVLLVVAVAVVAFMVGRASNASAAPPVRVVGHAALPTR